MSQYNLPLEQEKICTSWLFEPSGYLDQAVNASGISARQALVLDPLLEIDEWVRTNAKSSLTAQSDWDECAMVWWIKAHDQVNVTPATRPPEAAAWASILHAWDSSINAGFVRAGLEARNQTTVPIYDAGGVLIQQMPAGSNLAHQQGIIGNALSVLE